jgi:hypothetical protein
MEGNGDFGFSWVFQKRLERLEAQGLAPEAVQGLRERGAQAAIALQAYAAKRREAGDSGRYSARGLQQVERELAAAAEGEVRRALAVPGLDDHIRQLRSKLVPKAGGDPVERLLAYWQAMERRASLARLGVEIIDPASGTITYDAIKLEAQYRAALGRQDETTMRAIEEWPWMGPCPLDPELLAEGQARRLQAQDPVTSAKLAELETLRAAYDLTTVDALQELPLAARDEIAELAGKPATTEGEGS